MSYYNIHNLISVTINPKVSQLVIENVNSQIGYFKCSKPKNFSQNITIFPYENLHLKNVLPIIVHENSITYPSKCLSIKKVKTGFIIHSNYPNFLVNVYIDALLNETKKTFVHSSAVINNRNEVTLFAGTGGVGKTSLMIYFVNKGYRFLSDDLTILTNKNKVYSFPRKISIKEYYDNIQTGIYQLKLSKRKKIIYKMKRGIAENVPFTGLLKKGLHNDNLIGKITRKFSTKRNPSCETAISLFGKDKIADSGILSQIFYMQRDFGNKIMIQSLTGSSMCNRLISNKQQEWDKEFYPIFDMCSAEMKKMVDYFINLNSIISSGLKHKKCYLVKIPVQASIIEVCKTLEKTGLMSEQSCI